MKRRFEFKISTKREITCIAKIGKLMMTIGKKSSYLTEILIKKDFWANKIIFRKIVFPLSFH